MNSNDEDTRNCWHTELIGYCPDFPKCKGHLLNNKYYHEYKCSECGKYWMDKVEYFEVKDFKHIEEEQQKSKAFLSCSSSKLSQQTAEEKKE